MTMKTVLFTFTIIASALLTSGNLLAVLKLVHQSDVFQHLNTADQVLIVELIAETEAGELKAYIDSVGLHTVLAVIDRLPATESHALTAYLMKELQVEESKTTHNPLPVGRRDLITTLNAARNNSAFQHLSAADQQLVIDVLTAAENGSLTEKVHQIGYYNVLRIIDLLPVTEKHLFEQYLIQHLHAEKVAMG